MLIFLYLGAFDYMKNSTGCLLSLGLASIGLVYMAFARLSFMERLYLFCLARQSCYAAAISPAPALDATAVGAVDTAVSFAVFVDIPTFLTVTTPQ